jgi:TRAP-type C4-dicarboxylate transport system permease small subunit
MDSFLDLFNKILIIINKAAIFMAAFVTFSITVLVGGDILKRTLVHEAILWADEQITYMLLWLVFLPTGYVTYARKHIRLMAALKYVPRKIQMGTVIFAKIITVFFCLFLTIHGMKYFYFGLHRFSLSIPYSTKWIAISIPIGGALMTINLLYLLLKDINDLRKQNYSNIKEIQEIEEF